MSCNIHNVGPFPRKPGKAPSPHGAHASPSDSMCFRKDVKTESQLFDILKKQGFNEDIITKAMQSTSSRCLEDIIDYIEEFQNLHKQDPDFEAKEKKLEDDIRRKREESLKNQMYLQKLREQIKADQQEREQTARQKTDTDVVKSEVITDFGECTIKVRYDGRFCILHFKKTNTTADLLKKIEADFGLKSFKLFLVHPPVEIIASERTLEEIGLVPTGMVVVYK